jgi:hypothetical protein
MEAGTSYNTLSLTEARSLLKRSSKKSVLFMVLSNIVVPSLGGRQIPFAMYKLRLVVITERKPLRVVPLVEEIDTTLTKI